MTPVSPTAAGALRPAMPRAQDGARLASLEPARPEPGRGPALSTSAGRESRLGSPDMDMLNSDEIAGAELAARLAQGLGVRSLVGDFGTARGSSPRWARRARSDARRGVSIGDGYVDLQLDERDTIYWRHPTEHVIDQVADDINLARRITELATTTRSTPTRPRSAPVARPRRGELAPTIAPVLTTLLNRNAGPGHKPTSDEIPEPPPGTEPVVRGRRRARDPASAVPCRGLCGVRGCRRTNRRRRRRGWDHRR